MIWKRSKRYRLFSYDYSQNGAYFITIVVRNRRFSFGIIVDGQLFLSPLGVIVEENIERISERKKDIQIDEYQIMPDHIHLIVTIANKSGAAPYNFVKGLQPLIPGSVSSFINHFKGRITKWSIEIKIEDFAWQPRFHDHIIRNEQDYHAIKVYVMNNIRDWDGLKNESPD